MGSKLLQTSLFGHVWRSSLPRQYDLYQRLQLQFYVLLMIGAMDGRNMYSNLAVNKYLHTVASCWISSTDIVTYDTNWNGFILTKILIVNYAALIPMWLPIQCKRITIPFALLRLKSAVIIEPFGAGIIFLILAQPVYKMWIIQEPNMIDLWNKLHFEEEKNGECIPCLKYSVPVFVE